MRAILPAAGRGTRMAAVTGGAPKEILPLGGSTILARVISECETVGAEVTLVWSEEKGSPPIAADIRYQSEPLGLGHAIRSGLDRLEPVLVALPDVVFVGEGPLARLQSALDAGADFAIAVEPVPAERAGLYGIAEIAGDEDWRIERLIEKPSPGETASRLAIASRYALGPRAVARLAEWPEREFGITEVLSAVLGDGGLGLAVPLLPEETRFDCGSPGGYAAALAELGP